MQPVEGVFASTTAMAVAGYGLPGCRLVLPAKPLDPVRWAGLLDEVRFQRISGFLRAAITEGAIAATPDQASQSRALHLASLRTSLRILRLLVRVAELFESHAIDYCVLKGWSHAHLAYPEPSLRSFVDLDLLVPSHHFDDAVRALTAAGGKRRFPEPRPGFDRRFSKGTSLLMPEGLEVDLHRTFVSGPFGLTINLSELFVSSTEFSAGGRNFPALGAEERFLHACFHAVLGRAVPRLVSLRDVAQILATGVDGPRALTLAAQWRCQVVVAAAVVTTAQTFQIADQHPLMQWAQGFEPSHRQRRQLATYSGRTSSYAAKSIAAVRTIPRTRDKLAYVYAISFPRQRGDQTTRSRRWLRGARVLVRMSGRRASSK